MVHAGIQDQEMSKESHFWPFSPWQSYVLSHPLWEMSRGNYNQEHFFFFFYVASFLALEACVCHMKKNRAKLQDKGIFLN